MRKVMLLIMLVALAGSAFAADLSNVRQRPVKAPAVQFQPSQNTRVGGDNFGSAVVIPGLPFSDTGNTCQFLDDYDESCPYTGSTSPDVVYSFTPAADMFINVDLCGSAYDTKTYIYDAAMNVVGCNDDFYYDDTCGYYTSRIEGAALTGGTVYYIVVDGYGGDCGDYVLNIDEYTPCVVECPADAVPEGEPPLGFGYIDNYNGGCNSDPFVIQTIDWMNADDPNGAAWLCGKSGWYTDGTSDYRDTDWFEVTAAADGTMEFTVTPEYPVNMFVLNTDCDNITVLYDAAPLACETGTISWPVLAGETYWLWVGPQEFTGPVNEFTYFMTVTGNTFSTVPNDMTSWSTVKSLYK